MIYVLNKDGKPLMPTNRYGRVRHLLKDNKAKIVKNCPFTIELLYEEHWIIHMYTNQQVGKNSN